MKIRNSVQQAFSHRSAMAWCIWLAAPLLCLAIPGPGVLLAAIWILVFLWLGRQGAAVVGLRRPGNWPWLMASAFGLALAIWLFDVFAFTPLLENLLNARKDLSNFQGLEGNWSMFLIWLALGWIVGGIVEEFVFRGFLIQMGVHLLGERFVWPVAMASAMVFGLSHLYQGTVGVVSTGVVAFLFAVVFILSNRNLLLVMLVHGFVNSISLTLAFLGIRHLA